MNKIFLITVLALIVVFTMNFWVCEEYLCVYCNHKTLRTKIVFLNSNSDIRNSIDVSNDGHRWLLKISVYYNIFGMEISHKHGSYHQIKANMREIIYALKYYKLDHNNYPSVKQGLIVLTKKKKANGEFYLEKIPLDPWGNSYKYQKIGSSFEIISYGEDGEKGGKQRNADIMSSYFFPEEQKTKGDRN